MDTAHIRELLTSLRRGEIDEDAVVDALRTMPFEELGFARVDHHRALRTGFPEVIYGEGKTRSQIVDIAAAIVDRGSHLLVTRCSKEAAEALAARFPAGRYNEVGRVFVRAAGEVVRCGRVLVITAGTTDIGVAEEAAETAALFGCGVGRLFDVGVAGVHRLFAHRAEIEAADVLIVAAGMEGALASVVAGMTRAPVVALPTSVGYGASFGGLAALLGMMTSCAAGVMVVNIDNGFGAGCAAALIVARARELARRIAAGEEDREAGPGAPAKSARAGDTTDGSSCA